jgi:CheY-like chemotaxis protein
MQKVLVVSAEDLRPELARTALGQAEIELVLAPDAESGWSAIREQQPRLVIAALGGLDTTLAWVRRIREDASTRGVGLVVLLASVLPAEEASLRRAGASAVMAGRIDPFLWNGPIEKLLGAAARRNASIPVRVWVWYRFTHEEKPVRGLAVNISVHGMLLEADRPVEVEHGTQVETEFRLTGQDQALRAVARVVREAGESSDGRRRFGIEFLNLPAQAHDRIAAFVEAGSQAGTSERR